MRSRILELLFPRRCILCRKILAKEETDLCRECRTGAPEVTNRRQKYRYLAQWTAVWYYEDRVRESLLRFKFRNARHYAPVYGQMLAMRVMKDLDGPFDCVTWVPISPKRLRKRGYDQSKLIAEAVGKELGIPVKQMLRKIRSNKAQSSLRSEAERRANVQGVYEICEKPAGNILLVDDILTTGSTAGECARVMLTAGAERVACGAVAVGRKGK